MDNKSHPKDKASILSKLLALWLINFFHQTVKRLKNSKKLFKKPNSVNIEKYLKILEKNWEKEQKKPFPDLFKCLIKTYKKEYLIALLPLLFSMICVICQSVLIGQFINFIFKRESVIVGIGISIGITVFALFGTIQNDKMFLLTGELAIKIRANCNEILLKKVLSMNQMSLQDGKMTTIISMYNTDLGYLMQLCMTTYIVLIPIYFVAASIILYFEIGIAGVIVHFSMILTIPLIVSILKRLDYLKRRIVVFTEERLNWINNIVQGIKIIKIFGWEKVIDDKIKAARINEIKWHLKKSFLKIISFTLVTSFQGAFILLTYWIKLQLGGSLELNQVFSGVCILISSHFYITAGVSEGLMILKLIKITVSKINQILIIKDASQKVTIESNLVQLKGVFSSWDKVMNTEKSTDGFLMSDQSSFYLKDINFYVTNGQMCAVLGPVGSGKSTFLSSILSECHVFEGEITRSSKISYLSQEPWIIRGTIRDNILMGNDYEENRYSEVLRICELTEDINGMVLMDKTKVGEEGKLLSQGQKSRLALARSIYKDSEVYLMDDPFASLDLKIGENIMRNCFLHFLKDKARVLVINDIDLLNQFDNIVLLNNGYVEFNGNFDNLIYDSNSMNMIQKYIKTKERKQRIKNMFLMEDKLKKKGIPLRDSQVFNRTIVGKNNYNYRFSLLYNFLILGFKSSYVLLLFILTSGALQYFYIYHQYLVSYWSTRDQDEQTSSYYPNALLVVTSIIIFGTIIRNSVLYVIIFVSSKNIHNKAITSILSSNIDIFYSKTPKEFMDSFSGDIFQIDENLTQAITFTMMFGVIMLGYISYIIYVIPWNLLNIGIFIAYSSILTYSCLRPIVLLRQHYMLSSGPLTNICKETISGIPTIRSLDLKKFTLIRFQAKNEKMVNKFLNFFYSIRCYTSLISFGAAFLLSINFFFVIIFLDKADSTLVAVSLSFNIGIMNILPWFYRLIIEITSLLPSLNRVHSYTLLAPESKIEQKELKILEGHISFQNVTLAYTGFRELALSEMSFDIEAGKKFGIIGRSGSGKSSIFNTIYRLSKPLSGKILIDGQDISQHSLSSLRNQISFMSQNPFVFAGSLKFNIDPEGKYNNSDIKALLGVVGLDEFVVNYGLHAEIKILNLSMGQKQLLALCRVLIKNSKIILLDEATSNVDGSTEKTIENLIDDFCKGKTIIMIAHKLKLLMKYDMVMLVDNGCVVDILPPQLLLTREHTQAHTND